MLKFILIVLQSLVALIFIPLVRILRPLVLIRFGPLYSGRIGHFAANTELYLCERDMDMYPRRTLDIFYHTLPICNYQLKKMWDRILWVSRFAHSIDRVNRRLPGSERHVIPMPSDRDLYGFLARTKAHISFTSDEERLGIESLREMGVPADTPFVCFHTRDSSYLNMVQPDRNWRYHDFRDSSIQNYVTAAEELASRGFYMIRTGAVVKEALTHKNPKIIDYATKGRSDFMDIFLGAKCHFYVVSPCGICAIPMIFRRPLVWVNFIPLEYAPTWAKRDLFIPKKLWLRKEQRFMTFREIFESEIGEGLKNERYEEFGIDVIENTAEEIMDLTIEMDERLKGSWQTAEEDEGLQCRFWALFPKSKIHVEILSRIGAKFLRQNRELLEM